MFMSFHIIPVFFTNVRMHICHILLQVSSQFSSIPSKTAVEKRLLVKVIKATSLGGKKGNNLYNFIPYASKCKHD